jgi:hypothetical protein
MFFLFSQCAYSRFCLGFGCITVWVTISFSLLSFDWPSQQAQSTLPLAQQLSDGFSTKKR